MKRQILRLGLTLVAAVSALAGCESLNHDGGPRSQDDAVRPAEATTQADGPGDAPAAKGFFKSSRRSGAMSSEGRDIERSLGIP